MPPTRGADHARAQGLRFLASGAANTAITYALYCGLVFFVHPQLAYAIVFVHSGASISC